MGAPRGGCQPCEMRGCDGEREGDGAAGQPGDWCVGRRPCETERLRSEGEAVGWCWGVRRRTSARPLRSGSNPRGCRTCFDPCAVRWRTGAHEEVGVAGQAGSRRVAQAPVRQSSGGARGGLGAPEWQLRCMSSYDSSGASGQSGCGKRAGAMGGMVVGSLRWLRMHETTSAWVVKGLQGLRLLRYFAKLTNVPYDRFETCPNCRPSFRG